MRKLIGAIAALGLGAFATAAVAAHYNDGQTTKYYESMKGKKIIWVPQATGIDNVEGYTTAMRKQAEELGYSLDVRDPNWNTDLGAQALSAAIVAKPDLIVVMNQDIQSYARLLKQALAAGIPVLQVQVKSVANTDAYVGPDWYEIGYRSIEAAMKACRPASGKSGKIAIMQGTPTNPANAVGMIALADLQAKYPDIKVVSTQAGDWDATKAHGVAATVIKQNPDLCAYVGFWDGQDVGVAAAITEAGLTGKVQLMTSGGGNQASCDYVAKGQFDYYVSYDVYGQARDITAAIRTILQQRVPAGSKPFALYSAVKIITKDTLRHNSCWSKADF